MDKSSPTMSSSVHNVTGGLRAMTTEDVTHSFDQYSRPVYRDLSPLQSESTIKYLSALIREKRMLDALHGFYPVAEHLIDQEIDRVHNALFDEEFNIKMELPEAKGALITISEKIYIPVDEHPEFNFVGRIIGPRGMTVKMLQNKTGCKVMVRGRDLLRDSLKEELKRGKPNRRDVNEKLHVVVECSDTFNRAHIRLKVCVNHIKRLIVPMAESMDKLKRNQLLELSLFNGTYIGRNASPDTMSGIVSARRAPRRRSRASSDILTASSMSPVSDAASAVWPDVDYGAVLNYLTMASLAAGDMGPNPITLNSNAVDPFGLLSPFSRFATAPQSPNTSFDHQ